MKNFALLVIGFAAGYVVAKLSDEYEGRKKAESHESIEDRISTRLESLEKSLVHS